MINIMVVAPRFPSINQPWIDTYLEQLLAYSIEPSIYSVNHESKNYHSKVDRLGLRERLVSFSLAKRLQLCSFIIQIAKPGNLARSQRIAKKVAISKAGFLVGWVKCAHFVAISTKIKSFELIHSHAEHLAYDFLHLAMLRNLPLVVTFHGLPPTGIGQLAKNKRCILYQYVAKVLVNTAFAKRQVCSLGCDASKVEILPQGLPLGDFPFFMRPAPVGGEPVTLLTVGRYHRDKGQRYALLALRRLLDRGIQAHWYFVGVGPDRQRLELLVERLQLKKYVTFLEGLPSDQLRELYQTCHLFVLPSISSPGGHVETQGVVLQEAQASGCIPIASWVGGIPECVNHQQDALLVKEKSSRSIADAVQYLLTRSEEWVAYQEAGRRNVEENYSADVIGEKMAALLHNVVDDWTGYEDMPLRQEEGAA